MSWDIVLFNSKQKIESVEEVDESHLIDTDFDSAFQSHFENIVVDESAKTIESPDFSIVYYSDEPASNAIVNLYGENAFYELVILAKKHDWQLFDTSMGQMVDLENPTANGCENFQNYLKQVLSK